MTEKTIYVAKKGKKIDQGDLLNILIAIGDMRTKRKKAKQDFAVIIKTESKK